MFKHNYCGRQVFIDVTCSFKLLAEVFPTTDCRNLGTARIHIYPEIDFIENPKMYCQHCGVYVAREDLKVQCDYCGNTIDIEEALMATESSGIFCTEHIKKYNEEKHSKVTTLLSKGVFLR